MSNPHLLVVLSAHGYGHMAMTAPLVNALRRANPALRLTLRTTAPRALLEQRYEGDFDHLLEACDLGMVMNGALEVNRTASAESYRDFHRDWDRRVETEAERLRYLAPDVVLSNIAYLPLAAAHLAGIPVVAFCCLHWGDIYAHYCNDAPQAQNIHGQILAAYRAADIFLRPVPAMPIRDLPTQTIGPVARIPASDRGRVCQTLGLEPYQTLVLVSLGGIPTPLDVSHWPRLPDLVYLLPQPTPTPSRPDVVNLQGTPLSFSDALAACDVLLTKPGYGAFTEAACAGIPVLYVSRGDWPETPALVEWLSQNTPCRNIDTTTLKTGEFKPELEQLLACKRPKPVPAEGINQAVAILLDRFEILRPESCAIHHL